MIATAYSLSTWRRSAPTDEPWKLRNDLRSTIARFLGYVAMFALGLAHTCVIWNVG